MNPNLIPYGAIKLEFTARNLPEEECGRQFTERTSGHRQPQYKYLLLLSSSVVCGP